MDCMGSAQQSTFSHLHLPILSDSQPKSRELSEISSSLSMSPVSLPVLSSKTINFFEVREREVLLGELVLATRAALTSYGCIGKKW
uniref:Uncharacterized protein n=1 Tax=Ditylenchus dipsaci TaxID=166011 RepID=A0A915EBG7_9BILA